MRRWRNGMGMIRTAQGIRSEIVALIGVALIGVVLIGVPLINSCVRCAS